MWRHKPTIERAETVLEEERLALRAVVDPAAFAPLYHRYLPEMLTLCARRTGSQRDAEDLAGDIFGKVFAKRDTFLGGSFRKWIYTIAINTLRDHAARPRRPLTLFDTVLDPAPGPEELALRSTSDAEIRTALAQLPEEWQLVVELRNQGYGCAEVATSIGHDAAWVRLIHHRAMERLARDLGITRHQGVRHG